MIAKHLAKTHFLLLISIVFLAACSGPPEGATEKEPAALLTQSQESSEDAAGQPTTPGAQQSLQSEADEETTTETIRPLGPSSTGVPRDEATGSPEVVDSSDRSQPREPEEVAIEAADGLVLFGTFYPAAPPGENPGLLLLHMVYGSRQDWEQIAPELADSGFNVLAVDMRGHGQTGGTIDWTKATDDLQRAWRYLTERDGVDPGRTAVIGASIGANMALVTGASEPAIGALVLLSPGQIYYQVQAEPALVEYGDRPVFIVASEEDGYAAESSRKLAELAEGSAELVLYEGAGHGTRMFAAQPELSGLIIDWLNQHFQEEAAVIPTEESVPELFERVRRDRSIFVDGLVSSEQAVLESLPGATVYYMELDFAPDMSSFNGHLHIQYSNQEDVELDRIYFHLHANRLGGEISVEDVVFNGSAVEPAFSHFNTLMEIPLVEPLKPGEEAILSMSFDVKVPGIDSPNIGLFTASENELALAHFYPQIAVFDEAGWSIEIPPGIPDITYADSAYYVVMVVAPTARQVITSGFEIAREIDGDRATTTFAAGPVRDFYIASSDHFTRLSMQIDETTINSYGLAEFQESNQAVLDAAGRALELFNDHIGPYPFTELDIAAVPSLAGGPALGIEYPGIVIINSQLYEPEALPERSSTPPEVLLEATTVHEVGHQWFYSTVGNDQINEPWLDESLVQYITYLYYKDTYGAEGAEGFRQSLMGRWGRVNFEEIAIGLPVGAYTPTSYSAIVYGRGPLFFEALAEVMDAEQFDAFLMEYYRQFMWGIASGGELKRVAEEECSCDLTPLFADWVFEP